MDSSHNYYVFGPFRLDVSRRILESAGVPVSLSARAFDILQTLIEARDRVVSREEVTARVWPGITVDPSNLSVQMSALRKALGDTGEPPEFVATVKGRGYRFVGSLENEPRHAPALSLPQPFLATRAPDSAVPLERRRFFPWIAIVAGVLAILVVSVSMWMSNDKQASPRLSIVVLPFRNLSDNHDQDYLADAISDDLTTDLAHIPGSVVIARESADTYRGRAVPVPEIGRALNVRYLLEGSLRAEASTVHVNAQLIDTTDGTHLWASQFDTTEARLGETRSAIVNRIASALGPELVRVAANRATIDRPDNPDAIDFFLRARSILDRDDSSNGWAAAEGLLTKAIDREPQFSEALSMLGKLLVEKISQSDDPDSVRDHSLAREFIGRAISITPSSPYALIAKADLLVAEGRCDTAMAIYDTALLLEPDNVEARGGKANCALAAGHPEAAVPSLEEALHIDPLNPQVKWRYGTLAEATLMLGHYKDAIDWLRRAGVVDIDISAKYESLGSREFLSLYLIAACELAGDARRASQLYANYAKIWPHRTVWRIASYFDRGEAQGPGFANFRKGLLQAGMREYADESVDDHVDPAAIGDGDFDPTPLKISNRRAVTTPELESLLASDPTALVVDVGRGAAVMPRALWQPLKQSTLGFETAVEIAVKQNMNTASQRRIIVVGDGPYGSSSFRAAARLISLGYRDVLWYRGGEEAWSAAGQPADDRRS